MLTGELIKPRLRVRGSHLFIEGVEPGDKHWQTTAADLIALLRAQAGRSQADWERALEQYEGERVDYSIVRGLAKVLADAATFVPIETPLPPVALRKRLFAQGPVFAKPDLFHPQSREDLLRDVSGELACSPDQLEVSLFADKPDQYRLTDAGPAWTPADLLARYNLELARGVLYWASQMQIEVHDQYKDLWRYLKLFKLMYEAKPVSQADGGGYHLDLDGPISPFYQATTRYGRQFAGFLPALMLGEQWQMTATIHLPQSRDIVAYHLDHRSALRSHFKRSGPFDSRLEADFAAEFETKFGGQRGKWLLSREDEVLLLGDRVMIPDFAVTHKQDGRRALVELVGFWHPDYLRRKVEKVRAAHCNNLILVVYEGVNLAPDAQVELGRAPGEVLYFKNKPVLKDVMAAVQRVAR